MKRPKIICLCGSTRFIEQFAVKTWELELTGAIVLGCTLLPSWYCPVRDHFAEEQGVKPQRDAHHLQKIDLADEVLVLNIGGYIGESTRNEIAYAKAHGKPVSYLEPSVVAAEPSDALTPHAEAPTREAELLAEVTAERDAWRESFGILTSGGWLSPKEMEKLHHDAYKNRDGNWKIVDVLKAEVARLTSKLADAEARRAPQDALTPSEPRQETPK